MNDNVLSRPGLGATSRRSLFLISAGWTALFIALYLSSAYNYVLFHALTSLFCVVAAAVVFIIMWNARRYESGNFHTFLGTTFLYVAGLTLAHFLASRGMSIFPDRTGNLSAQFWVAAKYVLALSFVAAPMLLHGRVNRKLLFGLQAFFSIILFLLVITGKFPECFNPVTGLTLFKIVSEYVICVLLLVSMLLFYRNRAAVQPEMFRPLMAALALIPASEIMFTKYFDVHDASNFAGHCLAMAAFYLVYRSVVAACLMKPYDLLFMDMKKNRAELWESEKKYRSERNWTELALRQANDELEQRVLERTSELVRTNEELEAEVSERRKAQISLMKWARIFEYADWGVAVCSADGKTLELMNPAFIRMHGYNPAELMGRPITDVFARSFRDAVPEIIRKIHERCNHTSGPGHYTFESRHIRKDGSVFPVLVNASAVRDEQDRVLFRVVNVQDISMLKAAEEERSRLITAIESIDDAIAITDTGGIIRYVNPAYETVTGFRPDEVIGEKLRIMSSEFCDEATYAGMLNNLSLGIAWRGRVRSIRKDGVPLIEECSIFPVRSSAGAIMNFIAVKRDVTAKERLESIAEAVNSMNNIGYIFSGIRHELGNPINAMKTALNVLSINLDRYTPGEVKRYLARIKEELEKIEYLLKNLKSFSMFENLDIQPLEVAPFMDKLMVLVKSDFSKRGVEVNMRLASPFLRCHADPRALQQILLNVLANAADACEEGRAGKIVMSVFSVYDTIMIRTVDNGKGMVPEQINSMFKPFYTTKPGGTGLGLMLVKKMLSRMNGTIEITSDVGQGATVDIFLPEVIK